MLMRWGILAATSAVWVSGGGVGLFGIGADGVNGIADWEQGAGGSNSDNLPADVQVGAGATAYSASTSGSGNDPIGATGGGELSWVRNIPVTPGEVLSVKAGEVESNSQMPILYGGVHILSGDYDFLA